MRVGTARRPCPFRGAPATLRESVSVRASAALALMASGRWGVYLAAKKGARLVYEYDFGDGWTHDIVVESVLPEPCDVPRCTGGRRRCPPEDCGGPWGFAEFLDAIADPANERHDELCEWHGGDFDPAEFDVDDVNAALRRWAVE